MLRVMFASLLALLLVPAPALANVPETGVTADPIAGLFGDKKEEKEAEISEAEAEAQRKRADRQARVVVLKWPQTETDYRDDVLRRNVRSRVDRAGALFFPSVDLYQNGRKAPDRTLIPANQPAAVPDENIDRVMREVDRVSQIPWDAMTPSEWGLEGQKLIRLLDLLWFVEKVEHREPLFLLYAQIGNAAENQNNPAPPFYEAIGGQFVNYYFYLAATMAQQDPSLMSRLTNQELNGAIAYQLQLLEQGAYPTFPLDFELENQFNLDQFTGEYEVLVNGLPIELDEEAQTLVPLGRLDIYLKRQDTGHGLSERLVVDKLDDKAYFVRDVARKKMGIEFIDQLFKHPNECTPELDGDILNYLAIYAKLHEPAEIYIAVPKFGNPNKIWIWRYDRKTATLSLVGGGEDDFPIRFAVVASSGIIYNGANFSIDSEFGESDAQSVLESTPGGEIEDRFNTNLEAGTLPINLELRGHWNRLVVQFGMEFGYNLKEEGRFVERYYTPDRNNVHEDIRVIDVTDTTPGEEDDEETTDDESTPDEFTGTEALHFATFNRSTWFGVGLVLGRDAALGFGPRLGLRGGWSNNPRAVITTGNFGWTFEAPIPGINKTNRVRPLIDADFRGGMAFSTPGSLQAGLADKWDDQHKVSPIWGITAGIGTTF